FQSVIFDNIHNGYIEKTDDVKNLKDMRRFKEAWALFRDGNVEEAHLQRKLLLHEEQQRTEPSKLMSEINERLERLLTQDGMIDHVPPESLAEFHTLAERVPGQSSDPNRRVQYIAERIHGITSMELANLSASSLEMLEVAIERLVSQARATSD